MGSQSIQATNVVLRVLGTGIFHCGVDVCRREWSYDADGVYCCWPQRCKEHTFFDTVVMGHTTLTEAEVRRLLRWLEKADWTGEAFDILEHNCCHFSDTLCRHLGVGALPEWVTNLATAGVSIRDTARSCTKACLPCAPAAASCLGKSEDLNGRLPLSLPVDTPVLLPLEPEVGGS